MNGGSERVKPGIVSQARKIATLKKELERLLKIMFSIQALSYVSHLMSSSATRLETLPQFQSTGLKGQDDRELQQLPRGPRASRVPQAHF